MRCTERRQGVEVSEQDANARYVREAIIEPDEIARARDHAVELGAQLISAAVGA